MADNVGITAGSGTAIAADDIGSVFYQRVKLAVGADGEAADLDYGQAAMAASLPVVIASDQSVVSNVPSKAVITVTPTCDTNIYASGDLIFDSTEIALAVRANGGIATLESIVIVDKDDQGAALIFVFANALTDFGTLNAAPDSDDTEAATVIGHVAIATGNYTDLGGAKVACLMGKDLGLVMKAGAATTSLYVACINGTGTPTYTASGLVLQLGFLRS